MLHFHSYIFLLFVSTSEAIAHGKSSTIRAFPYQAALEKKERHICGAAIIGTDTLITAAHCLDNTAKLVTYEVRVGTDQRETGGLIFSISRYIKHPYYEILNSLYIYDIAIIWIKGRMIFSRTISPVALPPSENDKCSDNRFEGTVSGWGKTWQNGVKTKGLMSTRIPIWNQNKCLEMYEEARLGDETLCAGGFENGAGACKGDSGGPLVIFGQLCGIVSGGRNCGVPKKPGVYTNVAYFIQWIKSNLYTR